MINFKPLNTMKTLYTKFLFFVLLLSNWAIGQTIFDKPWEDKSNVIILDPYHANEYDLDKVIKDNRVGAIIHKASEGFVVDKKYYEREKEAKSKGLLWGSYHLGTNSNSVKQADFYLATLKDYKNDLIALDLEEPNSKSLMNIENGIVFINRIYEITGRYPVVYANNKVALAIAKKYGNKSVYSKCKLWYARFKDAITDFPNGTWNKYEIRQFASEINCCECDYNYITKKCRENSQGKIKYTSGRTPFKAASKTVSKTTGNSCPYIVDGTSCDMDVNVFIGNLEQLKQTWNK
jgi:hypothetical protein